MGSKDLKNQLNLSTFVLGFVKNKKWERTKMVYTKRRKQKK